MDTPQAWETLDLRADVIGRRTMTSGRRSIMSRQPLFFLARSVVQQVPPLPCLVCANAVSWGYQDWTGASYVFLWN